MSKTYRDGTTKPDAEGLGSKDSRAWLHDEPALTHWRGNDADGVEFEIEPVKGIHICKSLRRRKKFNKKNKEEKNDLSVVLSNDIVCYLALHP